MVLTLGVVSDLSGLAVIDVQKIIRHGDLPSLEADVVGVWLQDYFSQQGRRELTRELSDTGRLVRQRNTPNWRSDEEGL